MRTPWMAKSSPHLILPAFADAAYHSYVVAQHARERRDIGPCVACMVNDFGILVVSRVGGNAIRVVPQCAMMDS